jgi:hypothetical protein
MAKETNRQARNEGDLAEAHWWCAAQEVGEVTPHHGLDPKPGDTLQ